MVDQNATKQRLNRIKTLKRAIAEATDQRGSADKEKLIGYFGMEWGIARRTIIEYLNTLRNAGEINFDVNKNTITTTSIGDKDFQEEIKKERVTSFFKDYGMYKVEND